MAKRQSLASFAPQTETPAEEATTATTTVAPATAEATPAPSKASAKKYHSLHVYLTADEIRTIKQIALDNDQRASDIGATAIREWLHRNGHARSR